MAFCVICTELFDGIECLVSSFCGHVFHSDCLSKWIVQSETCPECRRKVTKSDLIFLYFNINVKNQVFDPSSNKEKEHLRAQLTEKEKVIFISQKKITELQSLVIEHESAVSNLETDNMYLQRELFSIRDQMFYLRSAEKKRLELKEMNRSLMNELELLNDVKTVIDGTRNEADKIFQEIHNTAEMTTNFSDALKKLVTQCSILKRQLQNAVQEKKSLRDNLSDMRKKHGLLLAKSKKSKPTKKASSSSPMSSEIEDTNLKNTPDKINCKKQRVSSSMTAVTPIGCVVQPPPKLKLVNINKSEMPVPHPTLKFQKCPLSAFVTSKKDMESISTTGYNGFGGQSTVVQSSVNLRESILSRSRSCGSICLRKRKCV